jgi:hypothetical protein
VLVAILGLDRLLALLQQTLAAALATALAAALAVARKGGGVSGGR